jgi:hypothetical protein
MTEIVVDRLGEEAFRTQIDQRRVVRDSWQFDREFIHFRFSSIDKYSCGIKRGPKDSRFLDESRFCSNCIRNGSNTFCSKCIQYNAIMSFGKIWIEYPSCPSLETVNKRKITYNNNLSVAQIKQVLKKIEYERKFIGDVVRKIENVLHFLTLVNAYNVTQEENDKFNTHYEIILLSERETYLEFYTDILRYYDNIPNLEKKYKTLLASHKDGNKCVKCFAINGSSTDYQGITKITLKRKKNCLTCNVCLIKKKAETTVIDCPVCLEDFKKINMIETRCGNGHFLCNCCYKRLDEMTTDFGRKYCCPLCRGTL